MFYFTLSFFFVLNDFSDKTNDIVVTWSTFNDTEESRVQYGVGAMDQDAVGTSWLFTDGGREQRTQWIHKVLLKDLKFDTRYGKKVITLYKYKKIVVFMYFPWRLQNGRTDFDEIIR